MGSHFLILETTPILLMLLLLLLLLLLQSEMLRLNRSNNKSKFTIIKHFPSISAAWYFPCTCTLLPCLLVFLLSLISIIVRSISVLQYFPLCTFILFLYNY